MDFNKMRKGCMFHKNHGERPTSSGLRFEELCTLRGKCTPENCVFIMSTGGNDNDKSADTKKA